MLKHIAWQSQQTQIPVPSVSRTQVAMELGQVYDLSWGFVGLAGTGPYTVAIHNSFLYWARDQVAKDSVQWPRNGHPRSPPRSLHTVQDMAEREPQLITVLML